MKIKKGDNIIVLGGKDAGKKGTVEKSFPRENLVLVPGVNVVKKHQRATKSGQKGQVIEKPMPINASNVALIDPKTGKATRVGYKMVGEKKVRVTKASGMEI